MRVAVVAPTVEAATETRAIIGNVASSLPLAAAVIVVGVTRIKDAPWWLSLQERCRGQWYTLDRWGPPLRDTEMRTNA